MYKKSLLWYVYQIFCFRTQLSIHEIKSPFSGKTSDVLTKTYLGRFTLFGKRFTAEGPDFSLKLHGLDAIYDLEYNPDKALPKAVKPHQSRPKADELSQRRIITSDDEDN